MSVYIAVDTSFNFSEHCLMFGARVNLCTDTLRSIMLHSLVLRNRPDFFTDSPR